jgi:hypothetical protein
MFSHELTDLLTYLVTAPVVLLKAHPMVAVAGVVAGIFFASVVRMMDANS